jgi:hypothetical protein
MKKLKLRRETISILTSSELERAQGGDIVVSIVITNRCPVMTNGCSGGGCQQTTGPSGTSVINPGGY